MFCLTPQGVQAFKEKLKNGEITPEKLNDMTSEERRNFFKDFLGEPTAIKVNELVESKLLLKNQQKGLITAVKQLFGEKTPVARDAVSKIMRMERYLKPEDADKYMTDLVNKKLGSKVTPEEAEKLFDLAKLANDALKARTDDPKSMTDYGMKLMDLTDYANSLKPQGNPFKDFRQWMGLPQSALTSILHLSAPFVQGYGMIATKEWWQGWPKMIDYLTRANAYKELNGYIIGHPDYKLAVNAKLGLTKIGDKLNLREETMFSSLLEHVPGLKIPVKASNRAFTGFCNYLRFTRFTNLLDGARMSGAEVTPKLARDIARTVNDFTGRGAIGKDDQYANVAPALNTLFFSPRGISATIGMFDPMKYIKADPFARQTALKQLTGMVIATGTILELAHIAGAQVSMNPTSNDFLKFKFGKTEFSPAGRNESYLRFWARMLTGIKTNQEGITKELGVGFGTPTRGDLMISFLRGKLAPVASIIADAIWHKDMSGEKFNIAGEGGQSANRTELFNKFVPITMQDYINMAINDPNNLKAIIASPLATFGMQMESQPPQDWHSSDSAEIKQFRQTVGEDTFKQANKEYDDKVDQLHEDIKGDENYKNMSDEEKNRYIINQKSQIKNDIFDEYNFTYERGSK